MKATYFGLVLATFGAVLLVYSVSSGLSGSAAARAALACGVMAVFMGIVPLLVSLIGWSR